MNISKPLKLVVLALTLWPLLYLFGFMFAMPYIDAENFSTLFTVHLATMGLSIGLLVFYVVHLFKTRHVEPGNKALWGLCLFLGSYIAMPIYWFKHVWPEHASKWPMDQVVPPANAPLS